MVKLIRNTGWIGSASKLTVRLDGEEVAKIDNGATLEVVLPRRQAELQVTQIGTKSQPITVRDGDVIEITSSAWNRWSRLLVLFIPFIRLFTRQWSIGIYLGLVIALAALVILSFRWDAFTLRRVDDQTTAT